MRGLTRWTMVLLAVVALGAAGVADEPVAPDFNTKVAPIFAAYCNGCHNADDKQGELVLETYDTLLSGGEHGAILMPGNADESRLIQVLTGKAEPAMPPEDNERPTDEEIGTLVAWIKTGAKGPPGAAPDPTLLVTPKVKPRGNVAEAVTGVAFAPDGKSLAVARYNTVEILSLPERSLVRRLGPHRGRVNAVCYSKDGAQLVTAAGESGVFGEASLWNAADGKLLRTIQGHGDSLYAAELSADGRLLATSSYDQQIKVWDAASGSELRALVGHTDAVFGLAFRPDGKVLASASGDRTAKLWDVASGDRLETFGQPLKELYCVAFSPDGKRVAAGGADNRIRVWEVSPTAAEQTNPILYSRFAHEGAVVSLAYSSDGKTLISAGEDRTLKVWDAEPMTERVELERQSDWAPALAVSPDGKSIAVGRLDGAVAFYDATSGQAIPAPPPAKPELASLAPHGVQSGTTSRIALAGKHFAEVTAAKSNHEKLAVQLVAVQDGGRVEVEVAPAADLPRGRYEIWLVNAGGESQRQPIHVDNLPQASEIEPNDVADAANPIALESDVWGVLAARGDTDRFAFDAKAGQSLVFEIAAAQIDSKANIVLTVYDASGRVLADNNDFGGASDPLLAFTAPADGRYVVQVRDLMLTGGGENFYRLAVGEFSVVTGVFPLSVPANVASEVELAGYHIPPGTKIALPATAAGEIEVPLPAEVYRRARPFKVLVGTLSETLEVEPNNSPQTASAIQVPATVGGRFGAASASGADQDYFRFESKAGQNWIIETDAARRGSPADTVIEVLSSDGQQIPRVLLQAVRDSTVTFRGIDGNTRDCRLTNWEEMQLNQLVYLNGEVVRLHRAPRGPDSGFLFYEGDGGKRRCYFDTSATVHAVDEPCFIVEAHAPGTKLFDTGLPVITLPYENDDDGERRLGSDSRLTFTAPADGAYLARVRDARGAGGDRFAYRLIVRPPEPGFNVSLNGKNPAVPAGSGKRFSISIERIDGFEGEVHVDISGMPSGWRASTPLVIQEGQREAAGVLVADADATQPSADQLKQISVQAKAMVGDQEIVKPVSDFGQIKLEPKPKLLVRLEPAEITLAPGSSVTAILRVERNGFDGLIKFELENLPHGLIVANIGLSGVMMPAGETERQIFIAADSWVAETSRPVFAMADQEANQCSPPVMVHVRNDAPLATAAPAQAVPAE
ncbi:MAG: pre-peptidase C-terminal domain-containing protein [Pirellulales bacterium]